MVICAVGINSQMGKSKVKLQEEPEITPLQLKLEDVVDQISGVGKWAAISTFGGMLIHDIISKCLSDNSLKVNGFYFKVLTGIGRIYQYGLLKRILELLPRCCDNYCRCNSRRSSFGRHHLFGILCW